MKDLIKASVGRYKNSKKVVEVLAKEGVLKKEDLNQFPLLKKRGNKK